MNKILEQIVELLPEGLSQTGIEDICSLIQETVDSEIEQSQKLLESKVITFLSTKMEDLKEIAREEVLSEMKEVKEYTAMQKVMEILTPLVGSADLSETLTEKDDEIKTLQESLDKVNELLETSQQEISEANELLEESTKLVTTLQSENEELESAISDMDLSEITEAIGNGDKEVITEERNSNPNSFLTEDVLDLAFDVEEMI